MRYPYKWNSDAPTSQSWKSTNPVNPGSDKANVDLQNRDKCVEKIEAAPVDSQTRGTLFFALTLLGGLVYDPSFFEKLITEEIMQESPYYEIVLQRGVERGVQQGVQQGARETNIKNIVSVLTERFPQSDVQPVVRMLESIQDLDHLTELHRTAVKTSGVEAFLQTLNGSEM